MNTKDILNSIYSFHLKKLKNLDEKNSKILILFSGTMGSGKSFIAKKIEDRFKGIRIVSDDVRDIIRDEIAPNHDFNNTQVRELVEQYLEFLILKLPKTNGFIILDKSIDRTYGAVMDFARDNKFPTFLIRIDIPKSEIVEQIKAREDIDPEPYLLNLDKNIEEHTKIAPVLKTDFNISGSKFDNFEDLFLAISKKMVKNV